MLEKIKEKWEDILLHIKEEHELTDVSFKTWLLPTEAYSMKATRFRSWFPTSIFRVHAEKIRIPAHRGYCRDHRH